jgi:hypothetical protein
MNTDSCKLGSTVILLVVLYKTVTLNEEHKVQVFENEGVAGLIDLFAVTVFKCLVYNKQHDVRNSVHDIN